MPQINKWEKPFHIERGDVYMADLGSEGLDDETRGSRQAGVRPVVVTQCNRQNRTSTTVVVAAGTSKLKREDLPYHVVLPVVRGLSRRLHTFGFGRFIRKRRQGRY
jgi:mRNA-degrading endonuclease toxin of MazEF toxin-antitoxin module